MSDTNPQLLLRRLLLLFRYHPIPTSHRWPCPTLHTRIRRFTGRSMPIDLCTHQLELDSAIRMQDHPCPWGCAGGDGRAGRFVLYQERCGAVSEFRSDDGCRI